MRPFPFSAVVGQEDAKLALRLAATDRRIGGVLLRGEKGSAKTTLVRGFAAALGGVPFVELPLGATEDRVVGSIDTRAALVGGEVRFSPGLLAAAHGGILYVDEVNLLADHLVDVLLDVAVSGENVVERDGVSHRHAASFVLVGSMNPEEGELRPQLLDRFGLCVEVRAPGEVADRVESVRRRLTFDATGEVPAAPEAPLLAADAPAGLPDAVLDAASRLALEVGAEGLRADLVLCRAGAALAALEARPEATVDDVRRVAPMVLAHRRRRGPFDPPVVPPEELEQALEDVLGDGSGDPPDEPPGDGGGGGTRLPLGPERRPPVPRAASTEGRRGRVVGDEPAGPGGPVAVVPTARALAARRAGEPGASLETGDLRSAVRTSRDLRTTVLCVDLSGSMGAPERAAAAGGTVLGLLGSAYERRERVALVTFAGGGARVVVPPTASIEVARNQLEHLETGGTTPLAAGIRTALDVCGRVDGDVLLVLLSDGRATGAPDAVAEATVAAAEVRRRGVPALVLDCESGPVRLGVAAEVAAAMGARHVAVPDLAPSEVVRAVRGA